LASARADILFSKAKIPPAILSAGKVANVSGPILSAGFCSNKTPAAVMPRLLFSAAHFPTKNLNNLLKALKPQ